EPGESHRDAAEQDVVVTITTSKDPVLRGEWLQPGALVCAAGANRPGARELDNVVLERAVLVVCDSIEQAKLEAVVAGELPGRSSPEDIVVFKSGGLAAWDVAIGATTLELARKHKVGTK